MKPCNRIICSMRIFLLKTDWIFSISRQIFLTSVASDRDQKNGVLFSHIDSVKISRVQSSYPTFGIEGSLVRGVSGDYYYTILYTQPDSPASEMGLKRGDHIFMVDSQKITSSNYTEYFQRPSKTYCYQVARMNDNGTPDSLNLRHLLHESLRNQVYT